MCVCLEEAWLSAGTCRRSRRSANAQEDTGGRDLCRYRRPPPPAGARSFPFCPAPVARFPSRARSPWLLVGVGFVPPSVRNLPSLAIFGKGFTISEGASPGWSPRLPALTSAFCAQRLLSRLPRPAPPRSEYEEGSRGTGLCRPAAVCGACGRDWVFWWQVAGKGRAHARVRGTPLTARGVVAGRVGLEGRRWAPGPTRLPVSPRALRRVCVPPTRVHVPATLAARSCRVWCVPRALGRLRLPPRPPLPRQRSHGRWRSREPSYPPFPLRGALEGP